MIVRCDQCNTKFRLDDSKVKENGVKVRCSKCKHIFIVQKEVPQEESEFDSILNGLGSSAPVKREEQEEEYSPAFKGGGEGLFSAEASAEARDMSETSAAPGDEPAAEGVFAKDTTPDEEKPAAFEAGIDFRKEASREWPPSAPPPFDSQAERETGEEEGFDFGNFDALEGKSGEEAAAGVVEDSAFAFTEETAASQSTAELKTEMPDETRETADFDTSAISADSSPSAASPAVAEPSFADYLETPSVPEADELKGALPVPEEEKAPTAVEHQDPGGIDFGEAPSAAASDEQGKEELPPLSIPATRRGSSLFPAVVTAISVLFIIALAGTGFYFLKEGPAAFNKAGLGFLAKWVGLGTSEMEGIGIRNPTGSFIQNKEAGEIFVVNGEAVNDFRRPRASIQVKAILFGTKGEVILQKTAYCGNVLSKEQLASLPMAKIEAAMNNQFGDSLSNLGVQPGKGIPFVVVFTKVPKEAAEFGIEVVGSTVASQ